MTEPLAKYESGRLWLLDAGAYKPSDRFNVILMREHFLQRTREALALPSPISARLAAECQAALDQHDKENS